MPKNPSRLTDKSEVNRTRIGSLLVWNAFVSKPSPDSCARLSYVEQIVGAGVGEGVVSGVGTGVGEGEGEGVVVNGGIGVVSGVSVVVSVGVVVVGGEGVGAGVGFGVGDGVGACVGEGVGIGVGEGVGGGVGLCVGVGVVAGGGVLAATMHGFTTSVSSFLTSKYSTVRAHESVWAGSMFHTQCMLGA